MLIQIIVIPYTCLYPAKIKSSLGLPPAGGQGGGPKQLFLKITKISFDFNS